MAAFTHGLARGLIRSTNSIAGLRPAKAGAGLRAKFGRMLDLPPQFALDPNAPIQEKIQHLMVKLASTMIENDVDVEKADTFGFTRSSNMQRTPAGYTYLAQFIDHDLTFDPASQLQKLNDPDSLDDFRTPAFDLDCLYGAGPDDVPYLYDKMAAGRFLIEENYLGAEDLPRNRQGLALIGDKRNSENQIVAQLHLAFLKYHNQVFDRVTSETGICSDSNLPDDAGDKFKIASRLVRYHYQWMVLTDFLPRIARNDTLEKIYKKWKVKDGRLPGQKELQNPELLFYRWKESGYEYPFMPVEFAAAAYRFGHSMVRRDYALNARHHPAGKEVPVFSANGGLDLRGFQPLKPELEIEWHRFFGDIDRKNNVQPARSIDTLLVHGLGNLPSAVAANPNSLAQRNLLRGAALGLPSGQDVARHIGASNVLDKKNLSLAPRGYQHKDGVDPCIPEIVNPQVHKYFNEELRKEIADSTPLWYYVLKEAEEFEDGTRLSEVGSRIVAEVFIGLLAADPSSFINNKGKDGKPKPWRPTPGRFGCKADGVYEISDLLQFAGAMNSAQH